MEKINTQYPIPNTQYRLAGKLKLVILFSLFLSGLTFFHCAHAQGAGNLTLSITPPLIKNNVSPGQVWRSAVRLVNNNPVLIEVYTEVVDFRSNDESGKVEFIRDQEQLNLYKDHLLSQWIDIDPGPYAILPFQSVDIPFTVVVPETAGPGGHYAAILAGTKPSEKTSGGSAIKISSQLASLILLRISGEEKEEGFIREFSTAKTVYTEPRVDFKLRFQNTGNVHLLPRGEIGVYDMFGSEKGRIKLNDNTQFGNVLPESFRTWNFEWTGEKSLAAMGRYRATLILSYGDQASETIDQTVYFWVIYPKILLTIFGSISFFVLLLLFFIRRYIRKSILTAQSRLGLVMPASASVQKSGIKIIPKVSRDGTSRARINSGVVSRSHDGGGPLSGWRWSGFRNLLIIVLVVAIAGGCLFYFYFRDSSGGKITEIQNGVAIPAEPAGDLYRGRDDNVEIIEQKENSPDAASVEITPEEINNAAAVTESEKIELAAPASLSVEVLNGSGIPGLAGTVAAKLKASGYKVSGIGNADNYDYSDITIRRKKDLAAEAEVLGKLFSAPATMVEAEDIDVDMIVIVGKGYDN